MRKETRYAFGRRIRTVRERKGLTMKEVAEKVGVTESLISQIERDRVSPSVDTLMSIADILAIDLEYLFRDFKKNKTVTIVRKNARSMRRLHGVNYYQLSAIADTSEEYAIEAVMLEIEKGKTRGNPEYGHPGKELGVILSGEGELSYGTESYSLKEGDSISFASDIPHSLKNTSNNKLVALWVNTPPRMIFG